MTDKNLETRLRRLAKASGYNFKKSNWRKDTIDNHGGYQLVEISRNCVVAGSRFDLSLQDVARELQRLHVLGRK